MRLSNKQAFTLVEILRATLSLANLPGYTAKHRLDLYNEIQNQQNRVIVELGDLPGIPISKDENGKSQTPENSPEAHNGD